MGKPGKRVDSAGARCSSPPHSSLRTRDGERAPPATDVAPEMPGFRPSARRQRAGMRSFHSSGLPPSGSGSAGPDATLPVDGRETSEPVLDGDWLLDSDAVVTRNDWRFTVSASPDELAIWAAQGLVAATGDRRPVPAPHLLARLREAVPLWHGVILKFEVARAPDALILGRSVLPARDDGGARPRTIFHP